MTDDLEERLGEALATRGRVDPNEVQRVLETAVLPARRSTGSALGRLVAAVAVSAIVVGAVALGLSGRGVAGPGPSSPAAPAATGPVSTTVSDGAFRLTIAVDRGTYAAGDVITVHTTLTYTGAPTTATVSGSGSGLVGFSVQRDGDEMVGGAMTADCRPYEFTSGQAVDIPYAKSGGYIPGASGADFARQYLNDPLLHLPVGAWHIHAFFTGDIGTCTASPHTLDASIAINVTDSPVAASQPVASIAPSGTPAATPTSTATPVTSEATGGRDLPDPAPLAGDPRYAVCTQAGMPAVLSAFEVSRARDLSAYLPGFALSPELQVDEPAFVVIYAGPVETVVPGGPSPDGSGPQPTLGPGEYDACVVVGAATAIHSHAFYGGVSVVGFDPAPSGLPALP